MKNRKKLNNQVYMDINVEDELTCRHDVTLSFILLPNIYSLKQQMYLLCVYIYSSVGMGIIYLSRDFHADSTFTDII